MTTPIENNVVLIYLLEFYRKIKNSITANNLHTLLSNLHNADADLQLALKGLSNNPQVKKLIETLHNSLTQTIQGLKATDLKKYKDVISKDLILSIANIITNLENKLPNDKDKESSNIFVSSGCPTETYLPQGDYLSSCRGSIVDPLTGTLYSVCPANNGTLKSSSVNLHQCYPAHDGKSNIINHDGTLVCLNPSGNPVSSSDKPPGYTISCNPNNPTMVPNGSWYPNCSNIQGPTPSAPLTATCLGSSITQDATSIQQCPVMGVQTDHNTNKTSFVCQAPSQILQNGVYTIATSVNNYLLSYCFQCYNNPIIKDIEGVGLGNISKLDLNNNRLYACNGNNVSFQPNNGPSSGQKWLLTLISDNTYYIQNVQLTPSYLTECKDCTQVIDPKSVYQLCLNPTHSSDESDQWIISPSHITSTNQQGSSTTLTRGYSLKNKHSGNYLSMCQNCLDTSLAKLRNVPEDTLQYQPNVDATNSNTYNAIMLITLLN